MATLVGRDAELSRFRALLDEAASGRAVAALVGGDAGVGKSRLVAEVVSIASARGFTVLSGQCAEIGDSVPYLPFADAIRSSSPEIEAAVKARPVLARLLPDGGDGPHAEGDWSGLTRQQMFGAVLGLLAELSERAPVLLVLEDLHWADASTRDLVTFLLRMLHRERVTTIGTYRTDDMHRRHPLRPVVADLLRLPSVVPVELGPLPPAALAEHLSDIPNGPGRLSAATINRIVARAEGNAYYAEELLASLSGAATGGGFAEPGLPSGLAAVLLSRVERVSDAAQQVLRAAAVVGRRAADEMVRATVRLPDAEYEEAVREAVAHQLLVPDGADGYAFRHALMREAVYNDLLPGERTRLHGRLAMLLSDVMGSAAELAHHSLASHDIPGAFAASIRAGQEAERIGAPTEAHRHYDQAIALWDRVEDAAKIAGMSRGKIGHKSATAAAAAGEVGRAVQLLRRIRSVLAQGTADLVDPGDNDPELRSRVGERLAYYLLQTEEDGAFAEALKVAEETVRETPAEPPTWYQARAMATYAIALMVAGDNAAAREWAQRARAVAGNAPAMSVEADALVTLGQLSSREGEADEAVGMFAEAFKQAAAVRVLGVELRAAYNLAHARLIRGELDEAARVAHLGVQRADAEGLGLAPFGMDLQHLHFQAHFAAGVWDHAQELADGFPVRVTRQPEAVLSSMALFIDVARGNQAVDERRTWLEPFWGDVFVAYIARGLLAEHALWRGDTDLALEHAQAAIKADAWPSYSPSYSPAVIRVAAVAVAARADRAVAARAGGNAQAAAAEAAAATELLELAREGALFRAKPKSVLGPEGQGWLARAEAECLRACGHNTPQAWQKVLDTFGPRYVYETARVQWRLAEALAEAGPDHRDEASQVWRASAATAAELGAAPLCAALDDLARRARLDVGAVGHRRNGNGAHGNVGLTDSLTERELEVLRLLARGLSNREIGAELFITPKTASVHVSNILGKLGAASRTEAAAIAHREGV
jgi:DNA-binding CsgD family transcriptional regulator/tetratricopeptide (TPR) repeat protein